MTDQPLTPDQRTKLLDQLYQRISKLEDASLRAADRALREVEQGAYPTLPSRPTVYKPPLELQRLRDQRRQNPSPGAGLGIGRRNFLLGLLAGSGVTLGAWGAANVMFYDVRVRDWLVARGVLPSSTPIPPTFTATPTLPPTLPSEVVDQLRSLQTQIETLISERDALRTRVSEVDGALQNANADLTRLRGDLTDVTAERDALKRDADKLRADLDDAQDKLRTAEESTRKSAALLDLYGTLEDTGLDVTLTAGLAATATAFTALTAARAPLPASIQATRTALDKVDVQMGEINAGLEWLDREIAGLTVSVRAYQTALGAHTGRQQPSAGLGSATVQFVNDVAAALPFTTSQEMRLAVQAMGAVVARLPELLNNVNKMTIAPARVWVVPTDQKADGLYGLLITPLTRDLLSQTEQIVNSAESLELMYNKQLAQPAQRIIEQRQRIRADIIKESGAPE
jgi:septal ring factor EnvC (AmiA/AmiB activator)